MNEIMITISVLVHLDLVAPACSVEGGQRPNGTGADNDDLAGRHHDDRRATEEAGGRPTPGKGGSRCDGWSADEDFLEPRR